MVLRSGVVLFAFGGGGPVQDDFPPNLYGLDYAQGAWVAVGQNFSIANSADGDHFRLQASDGDGALQSVTFGDGHWVTCESVVRDLSRDPLVQGFVMNIRDVSERAALQAKLEWQAYTDPLTGLANRARLYERLGACLSDRTGSGLIQLTSASKFRDWM